MTTSDYGPTLTKVSIGFSVPALVLYFMCVGTKFSTRTKAFGYGLEDLMLSCATISALCGITFGLLSVNHGFGRRGSTLDPHEKQLALFYFWLYQIEYKFFIMFSKLAMLSFYLKIFRTDSKFCLSTKAFMGLIVTASLAWGVANVFMCIPIQRAWDRRIPGQCVNAEIFWISHACFHIVTDLVIFLMPIFPVRHLSMSTSKKFAIMCAFGLGSVVCIADGVRIYYLSTSAKSTDPTYGASMAVIMTTIVSFLTIMCISLVTGVRKAVITYCRQLGLSKRASYQRSAEPGKYPRMQMRKDEDSWSNGQITTAVGRSTAGDTLFDTVTDDAAIQSARPDRDIIKKVSVRITDNASNNAC